MIDFGYFYDEYRPYILAGVGLFSGLCIGVILFIYFTKDDVKAEIHRKDTTVSLGIEKQVQTLERDLFFQAGVFPESYEFSCESNQDIVCDHILSQSTKLSQISLGGVGSSFGESSNYSIDVDAFFHESLDKTGYLHDVFNSFYSDRIIDISVQSDTPVELQSQGTFSDMEYLCFDSLEDSLPIGTEVSEQYYLDSCAGLEEINGLDVVLGNRSDQDTSIAESQVANISLNISSLRVRYDLFEKVDGEYQNYDFKEVIVPYNASLSSDIELNSY